MLLLTLHLLMSFTSCMCVPVCVGDRHLFPRRSLAGTAESSLPAPSVPQEPKHTSLPRLLVVLVRPRTQYSSHGFPNRVADPTEGYRRQISHSTLRWSCPLFQSRPGALLRGRHRKHSPEDTTGNTTWPCWAHWTIAWGGQGGGSIHLRPVHLPEVHVPSGADAAKGTAEYVLKHLFLFGGQGLAEEFLRVAGSAKYRWEAARRIRQLHENPPTWRGEDVAFGAIGLRVGSEDGSHPRTCSRCCFELPWCSDVIVPQPLCQSACCQLSPRPSPAVCSQHIASRDGPGADTLTTAGPVDRAPGIAPGANGSFEPVCQWDKELPPESKGAKCRRDQIGYDGQCIESISMSNSHVDGRPSATNHILPLLHVFLYPISSV